MTTILYVGNKNYSSWSLRAGLCLAWSGLPYEEVLLHLGQEGYGEGRIAQVLEVSPTGRVPALSTSDGPIWDSLAIGEWAAEQSPLWPDDRYRRAHARSVTCEMHSGFAEIRNRLPMNLHGRKQRPQGVDRLDDEIQRVETLWTELRSTYGAEGPWLFGRRSVADAFYLPVASRFRTYGVELGPAASEYAATALADEAFLEWEKDSEPDSWDANVPAHLPRLDGLYAERDG